MTTTPPAGDGRVAFIAGGSSGIGLATARRLLAEGYRVAIGGRRVEALDAAIADFDRGRVNGFVLDVANAESVNAAVGDAVSWAGGLDLVVHCVGSAPAGSIETVDSDAWLPALDGKVVGAVRLMRAALPAFRTRGAGAIVVVAGTAGREPDPWMPVAGAANAALLSVVKASSLHLAAENITVNAVCPGPVMTTRWDGLVNTYAGLHDLDVTRAAQDLEHRIPRGRAAMPEEVAAAITFLGSPEAAHITGAALNVDGGQSRSI